MTQKDALAILKLGVNVFLAPVVQTFGLTTGQAGEPGRAYNGGI